jgi:hypothetical protein
MSTTRDKLSLSSDAASKKNKIPKLKEVELKVRLDISKDTLLTYQHKHNTNTHFLPLKLKLNPKDWGDLNEIERHIMVNCLKKDVHLTYNYPVYGHLIHEEFTDDLLFEELNDTAESILWEELKFASHLITITKNDFVLFIVNNTTKIVTNYLDNPEDLSCFPQTLIYPHGKHAFLDWSGFTDSVISQIIEEHDDETYRFPFQKNAPLSTYSLCFIDLNKIPTLAYLFGLFHKIDNPFFPKEESLIDIKGDEGLLYQNLVKALIKQTSHLLQNICQKPVGFLFDDSVSKCRNDFETLKNKAFDYINQIETDHKKEKDKAELEYAETLVSVTQNQHLELLLEQGFYWKPIYFEVLTKSIKDDLFKHLIETFSNKFKLNNNDMELRPNTVDPESLFFSSSENDDPQYDFWSMREWNETTVPSELSLLLNASVREYFLNHHWLNKLNITQPKTKIHILLEPDLSPNSNYELKAVDGHEIISISNYFVGSPAPRHSQLILDVGMIKSALKEV